MDDPLDALTREFHQMDMAEMAKRMQAFMMKDPQRAAVMMEAMHGAGTSFTDTVQRSVGTAERLETELKGHLA